jgi:protein TonB
MLTTKPNGLGNAEASAEKTGADADSNSPIALIMASRRFTVCFIAYPLPLASPHFLMTRIDYRLFAALALSLSLHLLPLLPDFDFGRNFRLTVAPLTAELRPPPALPAPSATPPLSLPEQPKPTSEPPPKQAKPTEKAGTPTPKTWTQAVREHLKKLDKAGQFYPAEAITRGLEGEVLVLLIIDESGKVSAARVEQGSGQPILDDAALRAVRSLQSLPADAPRQVVLPVRFRLR